MPAPPDNPLFSAIDADKYRIGSCFVRPYDRGDVKTFGISYLSHLYQQCLAAAPRRPLGVLPETFCSMDDLTHDGICSYLHTRSPLLLMCVDSKDNPSQFDVIGFSFPSIWCGRSLAADPDADRSMMMGYVLFRPWYHSPDAAVCMMLTGVYYFHRFKLLSINGQSYPYNRLTRKFLSQFGARYAGSLPNFLNCGHGRLTDCVLTSLSREDFSAYVHRQLTSPAV